MFNGLGMNMGNLSRLSAAQTRSISPENFTGEKGKGGMATEGPNKNAAKGLGVGWKISPCINIAAGETREIANIDGPGAIQHIWLTPTGVWRKTIIRFYWDGAENPSVECPIGDFFAYAFQDDRFVQLNSWPVCVNPGRAFNCYWEMPFRKNCRITLENLSDDNFNVYYQIDYTLTDVPDDCAYFHASFRRVNPVPYKEVYTILDGVEGQGHYVGTYMTWGVNNCGWWGEGEIKFYMDGDEYPTICGTGTEDYFCGSFDFEIKGDDGKQKYQEFSTPFAGLSKVIRPDGLYSSQQRFSMYRWHIMDPVRFEKDLKVTIQALGWRSGSRYLPLQDDLSSVAYWYQTMPSAKLKPLPDADYLEII